MVKYLVFNSKEQIIGFYNDGQMLEYVDESYANNMKTYASENQIDTDMITASQVEDYATIVGATDGACRVYDMNDVIDMLQSSDLPRIYQSELMDFLSNRPVEIENDCPMMLYELLSQVTPIDLSRVLGERYA